MAGRTLLALLVAIAGGCGGGAHAAEEATEERGRPLWELGVAGFVGYLPDYPAAAESHVRGLGAPYAVYRGRFLQVGEKGLVRGLIADTDRFELDVSATGTFAADSDDNRAREGMPDLDWLGEVGPRLSVLLAGDRERSGLTLDLQVRWALSTDLTSVAYRGVVAHPELVWRDADPLGRGWEVETRLGPIFASERLMDYFYEVAPRFATAGREAFDAEAGYLGSVLTARLGRWLTERARIGLGARLAYHGGAANRDSPLFREALTFGAGASLVWRLWWSETRVP